MHNFEVNKGKHLLRASISALLSASVLMGCTLNTKPQADQNKTATSDQYCYNGGKSNDYSCKPELAEQQAPLHTKATDDAWMQDKLAEIKKWIAKEKEAVLAGKTTTPTAAGNTAVQVKDNEKEFLTTVSNVSASQPLSTPEIEKILSLSQQGQHQAALSAVNSLVANNPNNASAELTKGIVLSNKGDKQSAKTIFERLIKSHPDRPEAFNNLAVIYADEGNYPQAIETLQSAFQTHPSYAQVHSNLKELYATLASQAYSKALDLGAEKAGPDLAMIDQVPAAERTLAGTNIPSISAQQVIKVPNTPSIAKVEPETAIPAQAPTLLSMTDAPSATNSSSEERSQRIEVVELNTPAPTLQQSAKPQEKAEEDTQTVNPVVTAAVEAPVDTPKVIPQPVQAEEPTAKETVSEIAAAPKAPEQNTNQAVTLEDVIAGSLQKWANAWGSKDHAGYINAYTPNYRPNAKLSHLAWVEQRKQRLTKPKFINVQLSNIEVKVLRENLAEVRFDQRYQSDTYKDAVQKRVMMVNTEGDWKISLERTLGVL